MRALAVGSELSRRTGAAFDPVHALDNSPAAALIERATADDLLVVGSRGLRGFRALGSVSEAVAQRDLRVDDSTVVATAKTALFAGARQTPRRP